MFGRNEGLRRFAPYLLLLMAFMSSGCQIGGEIKRTSSDAGNRITVCGFNSVDLAQQLRANGLNSSDIVSGQVGPNGGCYTAIGKSTGR